MRLLDLSELRMLFCRGGDLFNRVASAMFCISLDEVTEAKRMEAHNYVLWFLHQRRIR